MLRSNSVTWNMGRKCPWPISCTIFSSMVQQPPVGQGLLNAEDPRSHSDTPQSAGLHWTSDQLVAETSIWKYTTLTTDRHPSPRRNSNSQSQPANGRRPTPLMARSLETARLCILGQDNPVVTLKKHDDRTSGKSCVWAKWTRELPTKWSWHIGNGINSYLEQ